MIENDGKWSYSNYLQVLNSSAIFEAHGPTTDTPRIHPRPPRWVGGAGAAGVQQPGYPHPFFGVSMKHPAIGEKLQFMDISSYWGAAIRKPTICIHLVILHLWFLGSDSLKSISHSQGAPVARAPDPSWSLGVAAASGQSSRLAGPPCIPRPGRKLVGAAFGFRCSFLRFPVSQFHTDFWGESDYMKMEMGDMVSWEDIGSEPSRI